MKKIHFLAYLMLLSVSVNAQLFTYVDRASSGFTSSQLEILDSLDDHPDIDTVTIVEVNDMWSIQSNGYFDVNVFGHTTRTADVFNIDMPESSPQAGDYYIEAWFIGDLLDGSGDPYSDYDGDIQLSRYDGEMIGSIRPFGSSDVYGLISVGNGKNVLVKYNSSVVGNAKCAPATTPTTAAKVTGPCDREIRVLVLYTDNATKYSPNPAVNAAIMMQLLNGGVYNSMNHNTQGLNFVLAGTKHVTPAEFSETSDVEDDILNIRASNNIKYYRDYYEADLVVCLTNGNYYNSNNIRVLGRTTIGPDDLRAYALVEITSPMNYYTFAHEIGHLLGARHQQTTVFDTSPIGGQPDNLGSYEHGYKVTRNPFLVSPTHHHSIVHELVPGGHREHYFSTPNVTIRNKQFGKTQYNDVTRWLYEYGCTVAEFRTGPAPTFYANIIAPFNVYTGITVNVTGTPYYGASDYDFEWSISTDGGVTYSSIGSSYNQLSGSASFSMPAVSKVYVKLKAYDNVGNTDTKIRVIHNYGVATTTNGSCCPGNYSSGPLKPLNIKNISEDNIEFNIAPNPASTFTDIMLHLPPNVKKTRATVIVYDVTGKEVKAYKVNSGASTLRLNTANLPTGSYTVKLIFNDSTLYKKLTIVN